MRSNNILNTIIDYFRGYIPFYRRNLKLAVPVMLAQLGQATVQFMDTLMVGWLGKTELAAVSFGGAIFFIGFATALGLSFGSTPLIGVEYSSGNHRKAASIFQNSIFFNLLVTIVVGGLLLTLYHFMDRLGQPDEVVPLAKSYYLILLASLPFVLLFQAFRQFMDGVGNTKYAMIVTVSGNILNIALNWVLIFGKLGCPKLGVDGAAYATLISRIAMCVVFIILVKHKRPFSHYFLFFKRDGIKLKEQIALFKISFPIGLQMFMETFGMNVAVIFVGFCGTVALASHQIAITISAVTWMISCGVASATTIRVSHQIGAKDFPAMRKAGIASIHLVLFFMSFCTLVIILLRTPIATLFTDDAEVITLASTLLIMAGIYQVADGLQTVAIGALRGMKNVITPMVVAFICYIIVTISVSYFYGIHLGWGAQGIWFAYILELYLASFLLMRRFLKDTKKYKSQNPPTNSQHISQVIQGKELTKDTQSQRQELTYTKDLH